MKEYALVKTRNVKEAEKFIGYLKDRPVTEMVGLGLLYGAPGLGKSRFARQTAIQNDYIYMRLESTMTVKAFTTKLLEKIYYHFDLPRQKFKGTANQLFGQALEILLNYPNTVIVIDEIDYAFKSSKILGAIRDIVDETFSVVILVGMADSYQILNSMDSHYFDRCNYFCKFTEHSHTDIELLCNGICDAHVQPDLVNHLRRKSKGNIRKLIKLLYTVEKVARQKKILEVGLKDFVGSMTA